MNVLFIARSTLYDSPGGDTIQIIRTAKELREINVKVDIGLTNQKFDYERYDIIHFFNIIRPADILQHFDPKRINVISTIFVDYEEAEIKSGTFLRSYLTRVLGGDNIEYLKALAKHILGKEKIISKKYLYWGHRKSIKYIYENSKALLPNSESEKNRLIQKYGNTNAILEKVVNAIDKVENVVSNNDYDGAVICVGRVERRKNQLNIIKAMNGSDIKCYIIGKPALNDLKYYEECKKVAGKNIFFIDGLKQEKVYEIMSAAKVHVLPSWFETTGLVSLEAYYNNCNIVITDKGDQREYFEDYAFYCKPDDVHSIREAIIEAYNKPFNEEFKKFIIDNYTWSKTAEQTKRIYNKILSI